MTAPRTPPAPCCAACGHTEPFHFACEEGRECAALDCTCRAFRAPASPPSASPEGEPPRATVEPSVVREACMDVVGDDAVPPGEAWIEDKRTGRIIGKITGLTAPAPSPSSGGSEETADEETLHYLAGIVDAKAHLRLPSASRNRLSLRVSDTDRRLVELLRERFGGNIYAARNDYGVVKSKRLNHRWECDGQKCIAALARLIPRMRLRGAEFAAALRAAQPDTRQEER